MCLNCGEKIVVLDNSESIPSDNCPSCGGRMIKEGNEEIENTNTARFGWILVFSVILIILIISIISLLSTIASPKSGGVNGITYVLAGLTVNVIIIVCLFLTYKKIGSLKVQ